VLVPANRAAPVAAADNMIWPWVDTADSTVRPRMVAPPWRAPAVVVVAPRPVTDARVSDSLASPQLPHCSVVALLVRHWPFVPRARRVLLVPLWYKRSPFVVS